MSRHYFETVLNCYLYPNYRNDVWLTLNDACRLEESCIISNLVLSTTALEDLFFPAVLNIRQIAIQCY